MTYRLKSKKLRLSYFSKDFIHMNSRIQHKVWRSIVIFIFIHTLFQCFIEILQFLEQEFLLNALNFLVKHNQFQTFVSVIWFCFAVFLLACLARCLFISDLHLDWILIWSGWTHFFITKVSRIFDISQINWKKQTWITKSTWAMHHWLKTTVGFIRVSSIL